MVYKINFCKILVSGEECAADIHATGGNPHIVYWYFPPLCDQMEINEGILPGHISVDINKC